MTYRISGLDPVTFAPLFGLSEHALSEHSVVRMKVTDRPGFPCRITLDDAQPGAAVLLVNHQSVASGPYAASHAIFVTEGVEEVAVYHDSIPPALDRRILSLRAFGEENMMVEAELVQPGAADEAIRRLFDYPEIAYIHAHNAVRGCFAAAVDRAS